MAGENIAFDLIGDVHGHAGALRRLLAELGCRERDGVYRHPSRRVIFVGDFIDRGPSQREVLAIVRPMIDSGAALAVMGNHEFNAVAWATPDPSSPGEYLRPHSDKNRQQHQAFLDAWRGDEPGCRDVIDWFRTLPLWLELPGLRVVHACWHPDHVARLLRHTVDGRLADADAWRQASTRGEVLYRSVEVLLKGLELPLPGGCVFVDKDGTRRDKVRTRWWRNGSPSWREVALGPRTLTEQMPAGGPAGPELPGYPADAPPVFLGHYWLDGPPAPLAPNVACLDYSVARGGSLTAGAGSSSFGRSISSRCRRVERITAGAGARRSSAA